MIDPACAFTAGRVQCEFIIRCFNVLHGDTHQLLIQIDRSSGHMSKGAGTLSASVRTCAPQRE